LRNGAGVSVPNPASEPPTPSASAWELSYFQPFIRLMGRGFKDYTLTGAFIDCLTRNAHIMVSNRKKLSKKVIDI